MNVLYCFNEAYKIQAGASIASLLETNQASPAISIWVLYRSLEKETQLIITGLAEQYGRTIKWINCREDSDVFCARGGPCEPFLRLLAANYIEENKILYLDSDTVVNGSLEKLWDAELNDYLLAGVIDSRDEQEKIRFGLPVECDYINTGVLVMNLDLWRKEGIYYKCLDAFSNGKISSEFYEQSILNKVCLRRIRIIEPKYNQLPSMTQFTARQIRQLCHMNHYYCDSQIREAKSMPTIIHYAGGGILNR